MGIQIRKSRLRHLLAWTMGVASAFYLGWVVTMQGVEAESQKEWNPARPASYGSTELLEPGPPLGVRVSPTPRGVVVAWDAPSSSGTYIVTNYHVESEPSGKECLVGVTRECDFTALAQGYSYRFRVRALSAAGWSSWSLWSDPYTVPQAPGPTPTPSLSPTPTPTATPTPTVDPDPDGDEESVNSVSARRLSASRWQITVTTSGPSMPFTLFGNLVGGKARITWSGKQTDSSGGLVLRTSRDLRGFRLRLVVEGVTVAQHTVPRN